MIYVDPAAFHGLKLLGKQVRSCHMWSDESVEELVRMVNRMGVPVYWMHTSRLGIKHFDLTERYRSRAIRYGATALSPREAVESWRKIQAPKETDAAHG